MGERSGACLVKSPEDAEAYEYLQSAKTRYHSYAKNRINNAAERDRVYFLPRHTRPTRGNDTEISSFLFYTRTARTQSRPSGSRTDCSSFLVYTRTTHTKKWCGARLQIWHHRVYPYLVGGTNSHIS